MKEWTLYVSSSRIEGKIFLHSIVVYRKYKDVITAFNGSGRIGDKQQVVGNLRISSYQNSTPVKEEDAFELLNLSFVNNTIQSFLVEKFPEQFI